jgi:hypothetical protein
MRRLRFDISFHPRMSSRKTRPDFLLSRPGYSRIVLEAVTVDEFDVVQRGAHRRKVAIYDALNAVECPDYFFNVETIGTPERQFRYGLCGITSVNSLLSFSTMTSEAS